MGARATTRVDELESAIRSVCEPYFDRPLKEISLGMVLMRLFQTSRRFHVEIQPQLVLLQKTLLNIEGLGRQLDPELDLWATAKPFLEKWMIDQLGPKKLMDELRNEAPRYAKLIPELPRLLVNFLQGNQSERQRHQRELLVEQKRTNRLLQSLVYGGVGFVLGPCRDAIDCASSAFLGARSASPEKCSADVRGLAPGGVRFKVMCPASSCVAIVGIPVPLPLAVGPIDSQSQHILRVGGQPPSPRQLEPLLNQIAVSTLYLT